MRYEALAARVTNAENDIVALSELVGKLQKAVGRLAVIASAVQEDPNFRARVHQLVVVEECLGPEEAREWSTRFDHG